MNASSRYFRRPIARWRSTTIYIPRVKHEYIEWDQDTNIVYHVSYKLKRKTTSNIARYYNDIESSLYIRGYKEIIPEYLQVDEGL